MKLELLLSRVLTYGYAAICVLAVALLGAADYYGYALFGETAQQQKPNQQGHYYHYFHK